LFDLLKSLPAVEDVKKLVGDRIRQLRKKRGLSQEELGYKSDLHYTHIGSIERGEKNWSIDTLIKVARGLNISVNDLLTLPSKPEDIKSLKKKIIEEINESSPESFKIFSDMVRGIKSMEANLIIQKRTKKK
jgi:transcriptional regulator with XRE-family HTH domain